MSESACVLPGIHRCQALWQLMKTGLDYEVTHGDSQCVPRAGVERRR